MDQSDRCSPQAWGYNLPRRPIRSSLDSPTGLEYYNPFQSTNQLVAAFPSRPRHLRRGLRQPHGPAPRLVERPPRYRQVPRLSGRRAEEAGLCEDTRTLRIYVQSVCKHRPIIQTIAPFSSFGPGGRTLTHSIDQSERRSILFFQASVLGNKDRFGATAYDDAVREKKADVAAFLKGVSAAK